MDGVWRVVVGHVANLKYPRLHGGCAQGAQRVHGGYTESCGGDM